MPRPRRSLLAQLATDAIELTRAHGLGEAPTAKHVVKQVLSNDSFQLLTLTRLRERCRQYHIPGVNHILRRVQTMVYGCEVGNEVSLGEGVYFVHPIGVVIGGDAKVGDRVRFMGNNTVGNAKENGYPTIEDDVTVGAGARILGPITIGRGAVIGANAVVVHDVPAGATVTGIPAKVRAARKATDDEGGAQ